MRTFSENRQTFLVDMIREWKSVRNGINMPQLVLQATLLLRGEILFAGTKKKYHRFDRIGTSGNAR